MSCHTGDATALVSEANVALVGQPNVGKSVLFHQLTGRYVNVANYPGTTVEIARGAARDLPGVVIIDTPGLVCLPSLTEDEALTARLLLEDPLQAVVQVGDAKNLRRTLLLTTQLAEMRLPLVLALNMVDEAEANGLPPDPAALSAQLGIPVIPTVAVNGTGIPELTQAILMAKRPRFSLAYPSAVEAELAWLEASLPACSFGARALGLLWLSGEAAVEAWLGTRLDAAQAAEIESHRQNLQERFDEPLAEVIQRSRADWVDRLALHDGSDRTRPGPGLAARLGRLATHPVWGWPSWRRSSSACTPSWASSAPRSSSDGWKGCCSARSSTRG